jgi:predicted aconitase with swiveling domain
MEVPMVDKVDRQFYNEVKDGDRIVIDADGGFIEIVD